MILLAATLTVEGAELDILARAVEGCDRTTVAATMDGSVKAHAAFLLDAFREQREIAAQRADLAVRRRARPSFPARAAVEAETAFAAEGRAIEDRQQALDDQRRLDGLRQDAVGYFRQLYLGKCPGKAR